MRGSTRIVTGLVPVLLWAAPAAAQDLDAPRPIAAFNTVFIEEMTWMEVRDAIQDGTSTVLVSPQGPSRPRLRGAEHGGTLVPRSH